MSVAVGTVMTFIEILPAVGAALTVAVVVSFIVHCARAIDADAARVSGR